MKTIIFVLLLAHHLFTRLRRTYELFTTRSNTFCQMVTPLLYWSCMMTWSGVAHSLN